MPPKATFSDDGTAGPRAPRPIRMARFPIGQIVRHRLFHFRGVIYDVDPEFANTEEWWQSIPADMRPRKDQPFYHLLAIGDQGPYIAYVSEQNLLDDRENGPVEHPEISRYFTGLEQGRYQPRGRMAN
ncbi:MAG: heat shock protein HspQ [Rhodospirillales bacterium]|nr:heat shock protein HspQ [Rhodospirillales bacterium]